MLLFFIVAVNSITLIIHHLVKSLHLLNSNLVPHVLTQSKLLSGPTTKDLGLNDGNNNVHSSKHKNYVSQRIDGRVFLLLFLSKVAEINTCQIQLG